MGECKWCGRKGLFVSVSQNGLCGTCTPIVGMDFQQRNRIIQDCLKLISESKNVKTRISRCDLLIEHAEALIQYEQKGIPTFQPEPSELARQVREERDNIILGGAEAEVDKALAKAEVATTPRTSVSTANKALLKLREAREEMAEPSRLDVLERRVKAFAHKTQLDAFTEAARKAEFKGNKKKALDQYQEALYFLKTDDIDDAEQASEIAAIEAKIRELGGGSGDA